jgi:hypothetical protein
MVVAMSPRLKKFLKLAVVAGLAGFGILQVFPAKKVLGIPTDDIGNNPPERFDIANAGASPEVKAIMVKACMDCHSNETRWPAYTKVAPGSWLMARDIHNGRNHLNLSKWGEVDEDERQTDKENMWEQIENGKMPPWFYIFPFHLDAKLTDAEKAALKGWLLAKKDAPKADDKADDKPAADAGAAKD